MKRRMSLWGILSVSMIIFVAGTVFVCWILNGTFLEKYYLMKKQQDMVSSYTLLDEAAESGMLGSSEFDTTFERLCANGNVMTLIIGENKLIVRSSMNNPLVFQKELNDILFETDNQEMTVLDDTEEYTLIRRIDHRMNEEYLLLFGKLSDGSLLYMRTALESIRESAQITNTFFRYVSGAILLVSILFVLLLSKQLVKPIESLMHLSKDMTNMRFEAKYQPGNYTPKEIDELGLSMNQMSTALEGTIAQLKSANLQLESDIQKKQQIDEMRKEFIANVSHELKTPLALIQGYAEGLEEGVSDDPESRQFYCEVIRDEADKMNTMVKKLLTLTQLEFGDEPVDMKRFDLNELVSGVLASIQVLLEQNEITAVYQQKDPVYVWGDEFLVEEVLTNYLSNAIHYAMGEVKKIHIGISRENEKIRLGVFNTGEPIPEEEIEKIWTKFYKVDKARTREYGGNGIGLSIVKAIMELMNQKCGVTNYPNGVEFWLELEVASKV